MPEYIMPALFQRGALPADSTHAARRPTGGHVETAGLSHLPPSTGQCLHVTLSLVAQPG